MGESEALQRQIVKESNKSESKLLTRTNHSILESLPNRNKTNWEENIKVYMTEQQNSESKTSIFYVATISAIGVRFRRFLECFAASRI